MTIRVALAACLAFLPMAALLPATARGDDPPTNGSGSGSGAGATSMPAFRSSSASREDAAGDFELPTANGDLQPSMDFNAQVNPTVSTKDIPLAAPQHKGTLKASQVDSVLRAAFPKTLHCFRAESSDKKAEVVALFVIAADGSVVDARIESSTLASPVFQKCVTGVLLGLTFPQPEGNGIVEVRTPFTFYP